MANPKVTVLMSVYNGERFLRESINSILSQTFKDFEFLIINDGSTDRTKEILESYDDPRIRVVDNDKNVGLTRSLNKGLELAKGEYIARMDADDVSLPERLEEQAGFFDRNPEVVLLGNWVEIIDDGGNITGIIRYPVNHCFIAWTLLFKTCLAHPTVMYRREEVLKIGGYNNSLKYTQDYDLWIRLSRIGKISQIPRILLKIRKLAGSIEYRFQKQQVEIAENVAFYYAKTILSGISDETFLHFFRKTKNVNLRYRQIKEIVSLAKSLKNQFFEINKPDHSCEKEITKDLRYWFMEWAAKNWKKPLVFFYLAFSSIAIRWQNISS